MNELPDSVQQLIDTWRETQSAFSGRAVRYEGSSDEFITKGDIGSVVEIDPGHPRSVFSCDFGKGYLYQPRIEDLEFL